MTLWKHTINFIGEHFSSLSQNADALLRRISFLCASSEAQIYALEAQIYWYAWHAWTQLRSAWSEKKKKKKLSLAGEIQPYGSCDMDLLTNGTL